MPNPAVELKDVAKTYGKIQALDGVDLELAPGQVVALLGPNGAGKTTLVRLMLGLARPTRGSVRVLGGDPRDARTRRRVGAMLQVGKVPETLRVHEHLTLFSSYYPNPLPLAETLRIAGLVGLEQRLFGELSGGQRQRVLFALAICGDPELVFLDEPTVGLDVEARRAFWSGLRALQARGRTLLVTTHYLEEADALAERVIVIQRGRLLADGTPAEIKRAAHGRRLRCVSSLELAQAQALPGVRSARRDGARLELEVAEVEPVLRALFERDPALTQLEVTDLGLEDAFLQLTGGARLGEVA